MAHYYQEHSVTVVNDASLSEIMNKIYVTSRLVKRAIELLLLDIKFEAKKAIKSQTPVDFLAD